MRAIRPMLIAVLALAMPVAGRAQQGALSGHVRDLAGDSLIAGARIELLDSLEQQIGAQTTDSLGGFLFDRLRAGTYRLRAQALGYRQVVTPGINVRDREPVAVVVRIAANVIPLAPLEVVTRAQPRPAHINVELAAFHERSRRRMGGTFITREEIDIRNPSLVTDMLKMVGSMLVSRERLVNTRRGCGPAVFLDGRRITPLDSDPDASYRAANTAGPYELEGVEVYAGPATLPPQFAAFTGGCGAVLLWTRRGPPGGDGP